MALAEFHAISDPWQKPRAARTQSRVSTRGAPSSGNSPISLCSLASQASSLCSRRPRRVSLRPANGDRGFSLAETVVATGILVTALVASAFLFALSTRTNVQAKTTTFATVLAQEKMEQLRGLTWGTDELGLPVSDFTTNLAVDPPTANGIGLTPSPENSLADNVEHYVDYTNAYGATVASSAAMYVRRWSVEPLPTNPNNTLVLQVFVFKSGGRPADGPDNFIKRGPDEARLISVKTRKAP